MHSSPLLLVMDCVGPVVGAVVFLLVMSLVKEPGRRTFNAIFVALLLGHRASHLGNPIWPFMPTLSFGCMIFDSVIALWFLRGAPSVSASASGKQAGQPGTVARCEVEADDARACTSPARRSELISPWSTPSPAGGIDDSSSRGNSSRCLPDSIDGRGSGTQADRTLVPARASRWDAAAHVTWLGEHRPDESIQRD